jgi:hypothetical protein
MMPICATVVLAVAEAATDAQVFGGTTTEPPMSIQWNVPGVVVKAPVCKSANGIKKLPALVGVATR